MACWSSVSNGSFVARRRSIRFDLVAVLIVGVLLNTTSMFNHGNCGQYTEQYTAILHDPSVRLTLVTGARLNELCSLKASDAHHRKDGWWITIREGKTQAALREVE